MLLALVWLWCGFGGALGEPWWSLGVALVEPWWSLGVALGWPWGGLGVVLGWLCTPESMPSIWPWGGLGVALGGFEMNSPQHPKWNQPRKGASDAARHSRSRSQNSLNAETQRFAEGRREGRKKRLYSRSDTRRGTGREKAQATQRGTAAAEVKTVLTQRRRDSQRDAEKEERKGSTPLRSSAPSASLR